MNYTVFYSCGSVFIYNEGDAILYHIGRAWWSDLITERCSGEYRDEKLPRLRDHYQRMSFDSWDDALKFGNAQLIHK